MKIMFDLSVEEFQDVMTKIVQVGTGASEEVVNAVERLQDITRQSLREQRRTARSVARVARNTADPIIFTDDDVVADDDEDDTEDEAIIYDDGH